MSDKIINDLLIAEKNAAIYLKEAREYKTKKINTRYGWSKTWFRFPYGWFDTDNRFKWKNNSVHVLSQYSTVEFKVGRTRRCLSCDY